MDSVVADIKRYEMTLSVIEDLYVLDTKMNRDPVTIFKSARHELFHFNTAELLQGNLHDIERIPDESEKPKQPLYISSGKFQEEELHYANTQEYVAAMPAPQPWTKRTVVGIVNNAIRSHVADHDLFKKLKERLMALLDKSRQDFIENGRYNDEQERQDIKNGAFLFFMEQMNIMTIPSVPRFVNTLTTLLKKLEHGVVREFVFTLQEEVCLYALLRVVQLTPLDYGACGETTLPSMARP